MRIASVGFCLVLALVAFACSPNQMDTGEDQRPDSVTGTVRVSGADGATLTYLNTDAGEQLLLLGEALETIRSLSGGRLEVFGRIEPLEGPGPDARVVIEGFELLEMNGESAYLGQLAREGSDYVLELHQGDDRLILTGLSSRLADQVGRLVWVSGPRVDRELQITSFGIAH